MRIGSNNDPSRLVGIPEKNKSNFSQSNKRVLPNWLPVAIVSAWQSYKFDSFYLLNDAFLFLKQPIDLDTYILFRLLSSASVSRILAAIE